MKTIIIVLGLCLMLFTCNSSTKKEINSKQNNVTINKNPELKQSFDRGKEIYNDFCNLCHMPNGKGVPKTFPPLANSDYLMNKRIESIKAIKYGLSGAIEVNGKTYNMTMTRLGLKDAEVADVMNYITNSWGNENSSLITEKEVSKITQ